MDIVSKKLAEQLNLNDDINENSEMSVNPLTKQPIYSSSLITQNDIDAFKNIENGIGLEDYSKIILMKTSQKALADHDELIATMAKVDDAKAARMAEVAVAALSTAGDAAKSLMNYALSKDKIEIEKSKLEIKSITINNINSENGDTVLGGTQKEVMDQIKNLMNNEDIDEEEPPPLVELN